MSSQSHGDFMGQVVWVPDSKEGFALATVVDIGSGTFTVEAKYKMRDNVEQETTMKVPFERVFPAADQSKPVVEDNCALMYLNEASLLHNTRRRYMHDHIYTYVANILIAVNPYTDLSAGLYTPAHMLQYKGKSLGTLPPHLYAIADRAYRELHRGGQSQSMVVSGESGAGKTESQKHVLRYLCESYGAGGGTGTQMEHRILKANPILEAFGNAKTLRNNNSSRFGKFIEIHFSKKLLVAGGYVSHYLLEKARVCRQQEGERNYHVFYQLLAGLDHERRKEFQLQSPDKYNYLRHGNTCFFTDDNSRSQLTADQCSPQHVSVGGLSDRVVDDVRDWANVQQALLEVGVSADECLQLQATLAALLHLGNVTFVEDTADAKGGCTVSAECQPHLLMASKLLGVDADDLKAGFVTRIMQPTKGGGQMGTLIRVPLKSSEASAARDALAKSIYSRVFDWIVAVINKSIPFHESVAYIGVLDIAGFEFFQHNGFEQFCINYCNEKLQQFFNDRILKQEQQLYEAEHLNVRHIDFVDNQDCIDLIELKKVGILDLLDEELKLPRPTFTHFTTALHQTHNKHFRLMLPRNSKVKEFRESVRDDEGFIVRHYAGAVCYETREFLTKNNDALHESLQVIVEYSRSPLIQQLFTSTTQSNTPVASPKRAAGRKLAVATVGSKFRGQLQDLLAKLTKTGTHFVRCVKPNSAMSAAQFDGGQVLSQLNCSGMPSVLQLMQQGYPSRAQFSALYEQYKSFMPPTLSSLDPRLFAKCLFKALGLSPVDYQFGLTKVFFRPGKFAEFDQMLRTDPEHLAALVAKVYKWLLCTRWKRAQWGALMVVKLRRKIEWRAEQLVIMQSAVRAHQARQRHLHRIKGVTVCSGLLTRVQQLPELLSEVTETEGHECRQLLQTLMADIQHTRSLIKDESSISKQTVQEQCAQLTLRSENALSAVQRVLVEHKEHEARLQLLAQQEQEARLQAQQQEQIQQQRENERMQRQALEERRRDEQLAADKQQSVLTNGHDASASAVTAVSSATTITDLERQLELLGTEDCHIHPDVRAQQQLVLEQALQRRRQKEQERLDGELAARLSNELNRAPVVSDPVEQPVERNAHDLSTWKYADLRDTINTSTESTSTLFEDIRLGYVDLLTACKAEFHRRLSAYHRWQASNQPQTNTNQSGADDEDNVFRAPTDMFTHVGSPTNEQPSASASANRHRFFRVPLPVRPSDQSRSRAGHWYVHFDGQYVVRQIERRPPAPPKLLMAGRGNDDLHMCEMALAQTGLTKRPNAEILPQDFDNIWAFGNGPVFHYQ